MVFVLSASDAAKGSARGDGCHHTVLRLHPTLNLGALAEY